MPGPDAAGIPIKKFKGQARLETGQVVEITVDAIDHIAAMVKVAATLSDAPVRVTDWHFEEQAGGLIVNPFAPQVLPNPSPNARRRG